MALNYWISLVLLLASNSALAMKFTVLSFPDETCTSENFEGWIYHGDQFKKVKVEFEGKGDSTKVKKLVTPSGIDITEGTFVVYREAKPVGSSQNIKAKYLNQLGGDHGTWTLEIRVGRRRWHLERRIVSEDKMVYLIFSDLRRAVSQVIHSCKAKIKEDPKNGVTAACEAEGKAQLELVDDLDGDRIPDLLLDLMPLSVGRKVFLSKGAPKGRIYNAPLAETCP